MRCVCACESLIFIYFRSQAAYFKVSQFLHERFKVNSTDTCACGHTVHAYAHCQMQLLQVCTCLTHTSPHIYPTHSTPPIALPPPLPCCPVPAATDDTKAARPTPKSRKNSVRAQMKELDAALSGVLQISSRLETDGSPLKDTLTDTLTASQQSQVRGQFGTSFTSVSAVSLQQALPPAAKPIIALPRPPQHGGGRRRQKGSGVMSLRFTPSVLWAYTLFLIALLFCYVEH